MSRTIRCKELKSGWRWYDRQDAFRTAEEFYEAKSEYLAREWDIPRYQYWSGEYVPGRWTGGMVAEFDTYEQYVAYHVAYQHKDSVSHWLGGVPSWFVNMYCERPLRAKHKRQIRQALMKDEWDDFYLEPFKHDAGWRYW